MSRAKYDRLYRREFTAAMRKWKRLGLAVAGPMDVAAEERRGV